MHDVGTLTATSGKRLGGQLKGRDTPTLLGVWEGGPYLHDGSAATLEDVLTARNREDGHGRTSHLTGAERADLIAFLLQLDGTDARGGPISDVSRPSGTRGAAVPAPGRFYDAAGRRVGAGGRPHGSSVQPPRSGTGFRRHWEAR